MENDEGIAKGKRNLNLKRNGAMIGVEDKLMQKKRFKIEKEIGVTGLKYVRRYANGGILEEEIKLTFMKCKMKEKREVVRRKRCKKVEKKK